MQDELRRLIARHCVTLTEKADELAELLADLRAGHPLQPRTTQRAIALAHEIRGSGGSIGFDEIFATATKLEDALNTLASREGEGRTGATDALRCLNSFMAVVHHLTPESSRLFNADLSPFGR